MCLSEEGGRGTMDEKTRERTYTFDTREREKEKSNTIHHLLNAIFIYMNMNYKYIYTHPYTRDDL